MLVAPKTHDFGNHTRNPLVSVLSHRCRHCHLVWARAYPLVAVACQVKPLDEASLQEAPPRSRWKPDGATV